MHETLYSYNLKKIINDVHKTFKILGGVLALTYEKIQSLSIEEERPKIDAHLAPLIHEVKKLQNSLMYLQIELSFIIGSKEKFTAKNIPLLINQKIAVAYTRLTYRHVKKSLKVVTRLLKNISHSFLLEKVDHSFAVENIDHSFVFENPLGNKKMSFNTLIYHDYVKVEKHLEDMLFILESAYEHTVGKKVVSEMLKIKIKPEELKKGDILLSYKTNNHLKTHFLSRLISIAEHNQITHSAMLYSATPHRIRMLAANGNEGKVDLFDLKQQEGEIWFVLRAKITPAQEKELCNVVDQWVKDIRKYPKRYRFAEFKSWTATFIGLLYTEIILHFNKIIMIPNIVRSHNEFFCSEVVDNIFKEIGINLVLRSMHDSVVGPAEFFFSPHLEHVGMIYNQNEREELEKEDWAI